ncbi:MAG: KH domain-containing protein [Chloroflexi bacterium]|nr:KH domain-containing protein [Chloroflexota bacterium]
MRDFIEYVAKSLVDDPAKVQINQIQGAQSVIYELLVAPADKGRVIGKQGRIANALRVLLRVAAVKEGKHAVLEIL